MNLDQNFWRKRKVLLTGHTGFKGTWMTALLQEMGAHVTGLALEPSTDPSLFGKLSPWDGLDSHIADIREIDAVQHVVQRCAPNIVIHMAAQALVRRSYREPVDTITTNIIGTINLLEALRTQSGVSAVLVVTSDKVYRNDESGTLFQEFDSLGGDDPYSASKAAAEIVTWAWAKSFFNDRDLPVLTARAGNVIGGGDFSEDRIVPDGWRAKQAENDIVLRYPNATRPWQHVMDLNVGYLSYIEAAVQSGGQAVPSSLNFGPIADDTVTVEMVARKMMEALGAKGEIRIEPTELEEKSYLSINTDLARKSIGWLPALSMQETLNWTAEWYQQFDAGKEPRALTNEQIHRYLGLIQ